MNNPIQTFKSRLNNADETISDLENEAFRFSSQMYKKKKKKTMKISKENLQDIQDTIKKQHLHYDNSKKRRERYRNYN